MRIFSFPSLSFPLQNYSHFPPTLPWLIHLKTFGLVLLLDFSLPKFLTLMVALPIFSPAVRDTHSKGQRMRSPQIDQMRVPYS